MSNESRDAAPSAPPRRRGAVIHGPEKSLLDGVRTWTDVFPWLRLVRVCRVAGGPVWVTHAVVVALIWVFGLNWLAGEAMPSNLSRGLIPVSFLPIFATTLPSDAWVLFGDGVFAGGDGVWFNWKCVLWTIILWLPTTMALVRVGALLTAGRDMPSYFATFRAVGRRHRGAAVIVLLPTGVAAFLGLIAWATTWLAGVIDGVPDHTSWAMWLSLPIVLPATLIAAVLIAAAKVAIPLGLSATMIEPDADPIDSLSRGYEYTLRRLPQLAALVVVAAGISLLVVAGWTVISLLGRSLIESAGPSNPPVLLCLALLPSAIAGMMLWSMVGGIYLLLRQSAGGQEIEDLAIDSGHWKSPKMPSVQQRATL